jgi:hypothetical protein
MALVMPTKPVLAILLGAVLLAGTSARAQQTPTLGELALKEQERRKALKASGAGKVLTNQDLPRGVAPATPAPGTPGAAAAKPGTEPTDKDKPEEPPKDEAWWKQRINQEREGLRRNEMFADALQTRINSLTTDFASRDDPYQRARIGEDRAKAILEMDRVKAEIEETRKKIAEIEEEARKAGVPPGWLR